MNDTIVSAHTPLHKHIVWALFDYLLSEMGSSAHEKGLRHDHKLAEGNLFQSLSETAGNLGLVVGEFTATIEQAVLASGNLTPLIMPFDNEAWFVLSGFSRGRIKVALIKENDVEIRLLKIDQLSKLLQMKPEQLIEWYSVELKSPMGDAATQHDEHHLPPLQRLFAMMKVEKTDLWRVVLLALASGILSLATPVAVQSLVNTVALGNMQQPLVVLSLMLFIFLVFYGLVSILQSYIVELMQRRVFVRMAADLSFRLPKVEWQIYDNKNGVELVNRFFDVLTVQKAGAFLILEGLSTALQGGIGLLVLAAYHPLLMLFDLLVIIWLGMIVFVQGRKGVSTAIDESISKYSVVAWLETLARNGQIFKFSGGPELARERTDKLTYDYLSARKRHYRILIKQHISLYALYAIASTAILTVGGILVMDGQLSLGQLVAAEIIVSGILLAFSKLKKHLESYYDLMAGVDKLGHLLDLPLERENGEVITYKEPVAVSAYDLAFNYPNHPVSMQALNFVIEPGEKVALYGEVGSGKSTLTGLLTGLRSPSTGRIEINHIDIRELQLDNLRQHIAVIGCNEMIEDSILENIRLGRPEISVTDVREVLKRLNLMFELDHIPEGIYTQLSLTGSPLSTTQIRKLLIARAIVGQPRLIIIDSLLDEWQHFSHSEAKDVLFDPNAGWTLLVLTCSKTIAHYCQRSIQLPGQNS
ncbi:MAG: ATP-binding cassette domain-containing protein [Methylococcaceae bacterium]|nr:ATP-binding cassette domain-containing protein [Methylococcaceae bacterium]